MRRFLTQNKIWAVFVSAFLLPILLVAVSESELDDVAAMVTNAKKAPNTIFIIDTSESMNSFAYSDYIETCDDAKNNAQHAIDICKVSLEQCLNVKEETGCAGGSIDCTNIANGCSQLETSKNKIVQYCAEVSAVYKFPNESTNVNEGRRSLAPSAGLKERFVGPWNPDDFYDEDLCFYDWTKDTDGNVLDGTTSEHWSNVSSDDSKWTTVTITDEDGTVRTETYKNTDRRDWDCITDGNNAMSNGQKFLDPAADHQGVSGFWLNWKYTTSLDAIKILLANEHEFSNPPRSRGENKCFRYDYKPFSKVDDTENCAVALVDGECPPDTEGHPQYKKKNVCYIVNPSSDGSSFDTGYTTGYSDAERAKQLQALRQIVANSWTAVRYEDPLDSSACSTYDISSDFSFYDDKNKAIIADKGSSHHPSPVSADADSAKCEICKAFNGNTENPAFLETECVEFIQDSTTAVDRTGNLGEYKVTYHQECCKTSKCTAPKCRDNDIYCYGDSNPCTLGYYSEFDQDSNHCCNSISCVSGEESTEYDTTSEGCKVCKVGTVITRETENILPGATTVLPAPTGGSAYESGVDLTVNIKEMTGGGEEDGQIEDMKVTLYYACVGSSSWTEAASFTCYRDVDEDDDDENDDDTFDYDADHSCEDYIGRSIMNVPLSGCENSGYQVKLKVEATGRYCEKGNTMVDHVFDVKFGYALPEGSISGQNLPRKVLDPEEVHYMVLKNEAAGGTSQIVNEYECKNAFYHTQAYTDTKSCPRKADAIVSRFHEKGYPDVQYCDPDSRRQESFTVINGCSTETKYFCSYLCRDQLTYDEPWKCMAWFYQMDEMDRGGLEKCSDICQKGAGIDDLTGKNNTEACCRCVDRYYYRDPSWLFGNPFFEPVDGVVMPDENGIKKTYKCAISGIMGSDTQVGWHAEIINGHIQEAGTGSYLLSPYLVGDALFSPYDPNNTWIAPKTFIQRKATDLGIRDTTISGFKTSSRSDRKNVCIYDLVDDWGGDMCSICSTCSFGCVDDPSMHVADDKCAYPSFWLKVPRSDGGELIFSSEQLQTSDSINKFKTSIKKLKAVGGPTLGETLYDAWRFLGGMYALHDPNHVYNDDDETGDDSDAEVSTRAYVSPFENQDASCFLNEVVIFSGGQPQFDHNDKIEDYTEESCPPMSNNSTSSMPCVKHTENDYAENSSEHRPYYRTDWYQSSLLNVANFVKSHPFYNTVNGCAKTHDLTKNILGYTGACATTTQGEGINAIHSASIGEWVVSELYNKPDFKFLEKITEPYTANGTTYGNQGQYCSLTLGTVNSNNCSFHNITDVISNILKTAQSSDINSGRPHWTSSLVQPFDVEEKYRGPEAYVAGTVPVAPSVSKFWFGNLKKYMVDDGDNTCAITITDDRNVEDTSAPSPDPSSSSSSACGEWHKQTFSSDADCFVKSDIGDGMEQEDFKRLLAAGAARKLSDELRKATCTALPCFKNVSTRTIYFDNGSSMKLLKNLDVSNPDSGDMRMILDGFGGSVDSTTAEQIFDYMYGYDAFAAIDDSNTIDRYANRKKLRFGYDTNPTPTIKVLDPIDLNFENKKEIFIRPLLLGAIVHSRPVAVYYGGSGGQTSTRVFAGANDGMLHAFDGDGNEKWAYIPSNALPSIGDLATSTTPLIVFNATVDGPITLLHIDQSHDGIINGGEDAYLIFGYRRGATGYTVIDVSNPDTPKFVQNINVDGGYSFGKAVVFRKCNKPEGCSYADHLDYYLAVPGGYDVCEDGAEPSCKMPENSEGGGEIMHGNKFAIYPFDVANRKFTTTSGSFFSYKRNPGGESDPHKKWLVASFASEPFAINTSGKGAVNTEFVYFTDLTGTVFRVDVRKSDMSNWTAKVVFAKRNAAGDSGTGTELWANGKSYVGNNFFPPLERYNPGNDPEGRIPVPVVFGDASWPRVDTESASMTVFYDIKPTGTDSNEPYSGYVQDNYETSNLNNSNQFHENKLGWRIDFAQTSDARGEKGITEPMVVYDVYGSKADAASGKNGYSLAWNTYIPKKTTECKNFGTSFNYERLVIDGSQAQSLTNMTANDAVGEWDPSNCQANSNSQGISIATAVGVVATKSGYDLTFGAGADIYRKTEISVLTSKTRIIKWYELY
jgi:Tfp pilus assembly protein, tip-associated adhesin PilY1